MIPHTGTILTTSTSDEHHTVLLNVVALSGDIRRDLSTGAQTHTRRLTLAGIGLLGPRNAHLEAHALLLRTLRVGQSGRCMMAGALACAAFLCLR